MNSIFKKISNIVKQFNASWDLIAKASDLQILMYRKGYRTPVIRYAKTLDEVGHMLKWAKNGDILVVEELKKVFVLLNDDDDKPVSRIMSN